MHNPRKRTQGRSISSPRQRLIIFSKYPTPGKSKTRLIPALGADGAAAFHARLVKHTLAALGRDVTAPQQHDQAGAIEPWQAEVHYTGGSEAQMHAWLGECLRLVEQEGADLGSRMAHAFEQSFREGITATVIVGTDCPDLSCQIIETAFAELKAHDLVLGPANDGGYYLIGLTGAYPALFRDIPWGTDRVLQETRRRADDLALKPKLLQPLADVDRPADLDWVSARFNQLLPLKQ